MKHDFRSKAREALQRAKNELDAGVDERLRYAALELRMCIEAITYDRAQSFIDELPPEEYNCSATINLAGQRQLSWPVDLIGFDIANQRMRGVGQTNYRSTNQVIYEASTGQQPSAGSGEGWHLHQIGATRRQPPPAPTQ